MTQRFSALLALLVTVTPSLAVAQVTEQDRFTLWAACSSIHLFVSIDAENAPRNFKVPEDDWARAVSSRLRAARLYDESSPVGLIVNVRGRGARLQHLDRLSQDRRGPSHGTGVAKRYVASSSIGNSWRLGCRHPQLTIARDGPVRGRIPACQRRLMLLRRSVAYTTTDQCS